MVVVTSCGKKVFSIDPKDFGKIFYWTWGVHTTGHIRGQRWNPSKKTNEKIYLHRLILEPQKGKSVDHINGDKTDNTRNNLRVCTHRQNCMNQKKQRHRTSTYKGVSFNKTLGKFESYLNVSGKKINLGYFHKENDAAKAYDKAARKFFGEFAKLNFQGAENGSSKKSSFPL